ncbi:O-antigen ligase family protein [Paraburkholderia sp. MMS20-SJTR3]|uniref:O-antigen ligase family protein n=1 Tax=Paraburkholderia sejongensis TaxID=2886946 RepID=A0ABS8JND5_9BURK|nr:O-antigen ligase family protein [Paraburkholderia sp. MMS20-SJTR3]MCC8391228.1 O-antigen ligase family protein [Paraburkholderia sp. MMS20-SJTR3]
MPAVPVTPPGAGLGARRSRDAARAPRPAVSSVAALPTVARIAQRAPTPALRDPLRPPLLLFGATLALLVLRQGHLVEYLFPLGAICVALLLYLRSPAHYLGFVFWLFFLGPEVRRLADFVNGAFNAQSPIMIAPLAAVSLSGLSLLKHMAILGQRRAAPLVLIVLALLYAFVVGAAQVGPAGATYTLMTWLYPVLISFYLILTWRHYPDYHRVLLKTFVYGGLLMSVYGLVEFVSPLPWTAFWLQGSQMVTEGHAVPFGMRVSSTMNSCGPFAVTLMALLLTSLAARGWPRIVLGCLGVPVLLLTSVRSAWGGFAVALLYSFAMLDGRNRVRMLAVVLSLALLATPLMLIDQVATPVLKRFDTMQNLGNDTSFQERTEFYKTFLASALTNIAGQGLGTTGIGSKLSDNPAVATMTDFDSGLMEVPYVMGWPGTLLYVSGIAMLLARAFRASRRHPRDLLANAGVGIAFAITAMMVFANMLTGVPGMFFFLGATLPVVSLRYAREGRNMSRAAAAPEPDNHNDRQHPTQTRRTDR